MSLKLDGKKLSLEIEERLNNYISSNKKIAKRSHGLAVIRIGEDPASGVYVNNKEKACSRIGIKSFIFHLKDSVEQEEVEELIIKLNSDKNIDGILLQLPIPKTFDEQKLISYINPCKDVDGLNEINIGKLVKNEPGMRSCTPAGIINLLRSQNITIEGKKIVVIGRSLLVGKPLSLMLLNLNGTVTITHSKTKDLQHECLEADVIVAAVGIPELIKGDWVKKDAIVIDVGINKTENGLVGDVDFEEVSKVAKALTPVPGGVGPMTIACLLKNTIECFKRTLNN